MLQGVPPASCSAWRAFAGEELLASALTEPQRQQLMQACLLYTSLNITGHELDEILNKKSGLLGISGVSSDKRCLLYTSRCV